MRLDRDNLDRTAQPWDEFLARGCTICEALDASGKDFFCDAFARHQVAATSESLVDAAGFCQRHARTLAMREELAEVVALAFASAIARFEELLNDQNFFADRLQQIAFAANDSCPACRFEHRRAAVLLDQLARTAARAFQRTPVWPAFALCSPHFQQVARGLRFDLLLHCVEVQIETLSCLEPVLLDARTAAPATTESGGVHAEALTAALRILRGPCPAQSSVPPDRHGNRADAVPPDRGDRSSHALGHATKCPVCVEMGRAVARAMDRMVQALKFGQDLWLVLPDCAEHVWACVRAHDPFASAVIARHAFDNTMRHLKKVRDSLLHLVQWEREMASAVQEGKDRPRIMRPPSPTRVLSRLPQCPTCQRAAIAHDAALERVLAATQSRGGRDALEAGYGLCCKHFADAYALTLRADVRGYLASIQLDRLGRLRSQLAREDSRGSWREALRRFCGEW
jgi:hypothetical protein